MVRVPEGHTKTCSEKALSEPPQRRATYHLSASRASSRRGSTWDRKNEWSLTRFPRYAAACGSAWGVGRAPMSCNSVASGANTVVSSVSLLIGAGLVALIIVSILPLSIALYRLSKVTLGAGALGTAPGNARENAQIGKVEKKSSWRPPVVTDLRLHLWSPLRPAATAGNFAGRAARVGGERGRRSHRGTNARSHHRRDRTAGRRHRRLRYCLAGALPPGGGEDKVSARVDGALGRACRVHLRARACRQAHSGHTPGGRGLGRRGLLPSRHGGGGLRPTRARAGLARAPDVQDPGEGRAHPRLLDRLRGDSAPNTAAQTPARGRRGPRIVRRHQARARGQGLAERATLRGREDRGHRGHPCPGRLGVFARRLTPAPPGSLRKRQTALPTGSSSAWRQVRSYPQADHPLLYALSTAQPPSWARRTRRCHPLPWQWR